MINCKEVEVLICTKDHRISATPDGDEPESFNDAASKRLALMAFMASEYRDAVSNGDVVEISCIYNPKIYPGDEVIFKDNAGEEVKLTVLNIIHEFTILADKGVSGISKIVGTELSFAKFCSNFEALERGSYD